MNQVHMQAYFSDNYFILFYMKPSSMYLFQWWWLSLFRYVQGEWKVMQPISWKIFHLSKSKYIKINKPNTLLL